MAKGVFCLATSELQAEGIINDLRLSGYAAGDISVLWPDTSAHIGMEPTISNKSAEGAAVGATTGGIIGGILGWLASVGTLPIPGIGPFLAAGPVVAALSGAALVGTVGGVSGALVGLGVPELQVQRYEQGLRDGRILIAVHTEDGEQAKRVENIFRTAGASSVCSTIELIRQDHMADELASDIFERDGHFGRPQVDSAEDYYPRGV
jgi:hypothetical protein